MSIKAGSLWSRVSFGKVIANNGSSVRVQNEDSLTWDVSQDIFDAEFTVADDIGDKGVEPFSRTKLIAKILEFPRTAMTIQFRKKVDPKDVTVAAREFCASNDYNNEKFTKVIREAMAGETRIMKGRHACSFDEHGRLRFTDMEKNGLRLIDPRTIEWAIVNGILYEVKK